jgi:chaperonin cofactor prefoldin
VPAELETVDIANVEIMSVGGPVHGRGSPPEGDHFTEDDLTAIADANQALADEIDPPNKIGHSKEQKLLSNSGLWKASLDDGEKPASGWWTNFRVENGKLLADAKDVPKKLAAFLKAGAFKKRSVEIRSRKSQRTGKAYDAVVTAVSWLGAKAPAIHGLANPQSLDDIAAAYADQLPDDKSVRVVEYAISDDDVKVIDLADGDVVWDSSIGYCAIRDKLQQALSPDPNASPRYWVRDVTDGKALVQQGYGDNSAAWVVPFTVDTDGDVHPAPQSEWVMAEQEWVETAERYAEREANGRPADTRTMPELSLNEDQVKALAEQLGVTGDDLTPEQLVEGAQAQKTALDEAKASAEEQTPPEGTRALSEDEYTTLNAKAEAGDKAARELHEMRRDKIVGGAVGKKITPAQKEEFEKNFDENEEFTTKFLESLPEREDLQRTYGSDDDGLNLSGEQTEERNEAERKAAAKMFGLDESEVPA